MSINHAGAFAAALIRRVRESRHHQGVARILPHRFRRYLLIDRIVELEPAEIGARDASA